MRCTPLCTIKIKSGSLKLKITISNCGAWAELAELKADVTASDVGTYSKGESDQRFQPLGNYTLSGYSHSKAKYQPKGSYAPAGNYGAKNTASKAPSGWWKCRR